MLCFSEFGRRVAENDSAGTDHGTAGPVLIAGSKVRPGLAETTPSLTDLADGDLKWSVDFRRIYASVLGEWLQIPGQARAMRRGAAIDVSDMMVLQHECRPAGRIVFLACKYRAASSGAQSLSYRGRMVDKVNGVRSLRRVWASAREYVLIRPSSAAVKTDWPSAEKVGVVGSRPPGTSAVGAVTSVITGLCVFCSSESAATRSRHDDSPRSPRQVCKRDAAGGRDRHARRPLNHRATRGRSGPRRGGPAGGQDLMAGFGHLEPPDM